MTMCLGVNLGDAVILAADRRRTRTSGERFDDFQKLVKITDTLWCAGAGNVPLSAYLQAVLAERQPVDVARYLLMLQPFAQKTLAARAELFDTLARQPGHAAHTGATVMSVLLVGGFDPASGGMALYGFPSGDNFETRVWPTMATVCIGGSQRDQYAAHLLLQHAGHAPTPERFADACRLALREVATMNPDIGPTCDIVIVRRTDSEFQSGQQT
jgi:Proteasome subunit